MYVGEKIGEQIQVFRTASGLRACYFALLATPRRCFEDELRDAWNEENEKKKKKKKRIFFLLFFTRRNARVLERRSGGWRVIGDFHSTQGEGVQPGIVSVRF